MMEPEDSTLWERSRHGDEQAFAVLFDRHARLIYNYCFRRLGDWASAEDMVSVVFLEAWRRREKQLPPGKVVPWLYGIATNVVRNRRRAQRRYTAALSALPPARDEVAFSEDADERVDAGRQMRHVLRSLKSLPRGEQDVIALCLWSDLTYEDAALALNVPVGTIRSRLARARQHLRDLDLSLERPDRVRSTATEVVNP
jgi:RNA polymerase sigma factor (sigma-70 family)